MRISISARQSALSRIQAFTVGLRLTQIQHSTPIEISYHFRDSLGDKNLTDPLWKIPEKGVFTADFLQDLVQGKTDMVVHSWKDLPTELTAETTIAATLPRADSRDLLLLKKSSWGKKDLKCFSSSPRRAHNLKALLPQLIPWSVVDFEFENVRGNIQTRVRKLLENPEVDGLILAKAAFDRMLTTDALRQEIIKSSAAKSVEEAFEKSWPEFQEIKKFLSQALDQVHWMALPLSQNPTAAAQGALAVEIRKDRKDLTEILGKFNSQTTFAAVEEERNLLRSFGGGCHLALGMSVQRNSSYSVISVRGKTPGGEQLEKLDFQQTRTVPQFSAEDLWSWGDAPVKRESLSLEEIEEPLLKVSAQKNCGFIVSRRESLPNIWDENKIKDLHLWAAGVQTWKKLAQDGYWVHGTYDGLGDDHEPETESLLGDMRWHRLTHDKNPHFKRDRHLITYSMDLESMNKIRGEQFFFWKSGSQFLKALQDYPHIAKLYHATGPGATLQTLKQHLPPEIYEKQVFVFHSEEDWRRKCQK